MKSRPGTIILLVPISLAITILYLFLQFSAATSKTTSSSPFNVELVNSIGGSIRNLYISDTIAFVGQGITFAALDISDLDQISRLSYVNISRNSEDIEISGTLAYVPGGFGGILHIIDISNPSNMTLIGTYTSTMHINTVEIVGNLVYLTSSTAYTSSMQIIDVTDPSNPIYVNEYSFPDRDRFMGIDIVDNLAYVTGYWGLTIINVSDPMNLILEGSQLYRFHDLWDKDIVVSGTLAIVVGQMRYPDPLPPDWSLFVIDVSIPSTPTMISTFLNHNYYYTTLELKGNFAYVGGPSVFDIIDLSIPTTPTLIASYSTPSPDINIVDSIAYLSDGAGMKIIDISTIPTLTLIASYRHFSNFGDLATNQHYIFSPNTGINKLQILDITNPNSPTVLMSNLISETYGQIEVVSTTVYILNQHNGLDIFDVTDPTSPTHLGKYYQPLGTTQSLEIDGDYAYLGDISFGLTIVDVSDPTTPEYLGVNPISGAGPQDIKAIGSLVYIAAGNKGLIIIDVTDPYQPEIIGQSPEVWGRGIDVVGSLAYVTSSEGLHVFEVSNPYSPTYLIHYPLSGLGAGPIDVIDKIAYIVDSNKGMWFLDVRDPFGITLLEHCDYIPGGTEDFVVIGDYVYLASSWGGLNILHISKDQPYDIFLPVIIH